MKLIHMTVEQGGMQELVGIELTRRNLQALLAKLDEPNSERTILKSGFFVRGVEDEAHYTEREAGRMSPTTEAAIERMRT